MDAQTTNIIWSSTTEIKCNQNVKFLRNYTIQLFHVTLGRIKTQRGCTIIKFRWILRKKIATADFWLLHPEHILLDSWVPNFADHKHYLIKFRRKKLRSSISSWHNRLGTIVLVSFRAMYQKRKFDGFLYSFFHSLWLINRRSFYFMQGSLFGSG